MSEYYRTEKEQIYADFAYRQGRIITQYEKMSIDEEKFEATLYVTVLQSLLTNCKEYVTNMMSLMTRSEKYKSDFKKDIESVGWGLKNNCWIENTYCNNGQKEKLNLENFITRIRNSVSHPTEINIESDFISTGFTTIKDGSGIIKKFRFVDSPDIVRSKQKGYNEYQVAKFREDGKFPNEVKFMKNDRGMYFPSINSKPFVRASIIDLTVEELALFVKNLANYLAQPIRKNWDKETIEWLLAA
jgi:hypothetical protein